MNVLITFVLSLFIITACGSESNSRISAIRTTKNAAVSNRTLSLTSLNTAEQYQAFSKESGGLVQNGRSVKFLIDLRKGAQTYFVNANFNGRCVVIGGTDCSKYHYDFAREQLGISDSINTFNQTTYFTLNKHFAAGTVSTYTLKDRGEIYAIQLYPQDFAKEENILSIAAAVKAAMPLASSKFVFVPTGNQQSVAEVTEKLKALSIDVLALDDILGSSSYIPMHTGEAWGYLRLFPKNQEEILPTDIVAFDELPLDLTVVAGVITKAFQDSNSHINLKSKERNTPNMVLRDASIDNVSLAPWVDRPVHLTVSKSGWTIEATTDEVIQNKAKVRLAKPWIGIKWTASKTLLSYDEMCPGRTSRCLTLGTTYGSKAANLGFLKEVFKDRKVPESETLSYDPVPKGFGVPLKFYKDFIDLPANAEIKTKLDAFIAQEKSGLMSVADRGRLSLELRNLFLNAEVPAANLARILGQMKKVDANIVKWKIRSSANAEDIENFDGAGLHDSYSSKLSTADNATHSCQLVLDDDAVAGEVTKMKVKPKTVACAIKGVYASLWNRRAVDERSFARLDHATVAMGLSILPSYDTESPVVANSVVVTRVINSPDILGYALSIQKDNNTVTNPTPGTWSELTIAAVGGEGETPSLTTLRFAKPTPTSDVLKESVLPVVTTLQMAALSRKIEEAYCRAKPGYYRKDCSEVSSDSAKPKALDLEMKYLQNGEFVIKQVREFSGR